MDVLKVARRSHKIQEARLRSDVNKSFAEDKAIVSRRFLLLNEN